MNEPSMPSFEKPPVPQINKDTGVSYDYANYLITPLHFYFLTHNFDESKKILLDHTDFKKYHEVYPPEKYAEPIIDDKNHAAIEGLNEIIDEICGVKELSAARLKELWCRAEILIHGGADCVRMKSLFPSEAK